MGNPITKHPRIGDSNITVDDAMPAGGVTDAMLAAAARGRIKYTGASGWANLDAKGSGKILVGDGTDVNSVAVSGDVALSTAGAVTIGAGAVTGAKASANQSVRRVTMPIGTVPTTGSVKVNLLVPATGAIAALKFCSKDSLAGHDTNYFDIAVVNKLATGAGTAVLTLADATDTTKITGGSNGIVADASTNFGVTGGAVNANEVLEVTITAHGTLPNTLTNNFVSVTVSTTT